MCLSDSVQLAVGEKCDMKVTAGAIEGSFIGTSNLQLNKGDHAVWNWNELTPGTTSLDYTIQHCTVSEASSKQITLFGIVTRKQFAVIGGARNSIICSVHELRTFCAYRL
jgi:hypothetical protein